MDEKLHVKYDIIMILYFLGGWEILLYIVLDDVPQTPQELLERIRDDYVKNNYLWTGNIYLPAFDENCTFTDPTLSFVGRQTFVTNVANLQPFLKILKIEKAASELRSIQLNDTHVQSQWTMKGQFMALPWKPKILYVP